MKSNIKMNLERISIAFENHMISCLNDVFKIPNAQLYFIQFMESAGIHSFLENLDKNFVILDRLNLVKFYLHVESFKASFLSKSTLDPDFLNGINPL